MNIAPKLSAKDAPDLSRFDWEDPFRLEDQLTEDERMIRDAARAFARTSSRRASSRPTERQASTPGSSARWAKPGLLGVTVPEEYGGAGRGLCHLRPGRARGRAGRFSGYRSMMSVQSSLVMYPIYAYGSEEQRKKYLPELATGELDRLFRPDRTRRRQRSRRHEDPRGEDRRRATS